MIIVTDRFGVLEIEDSSVIRLPRGLMGHEYSTEFCIVSEDPSASVKWLQSTMEPDVALMIADPTQFVSSYGFDLSEVEVSFLGIQGNGDVAVISTVTECLTPGEGIIDLCNPIVINVKTLTGLQVALEDERYMEGITKIRWSDEENQAQAA